MVAYSMGITELDPLKHGLIFERFLNPERVSLPDIDVDFDPEVVRESSNTAAKNTAPIRSPSA